MPIKHPKPIFDTLPNLPVGRHGIAGLLESVFPGGQVPEWAHSDCEHALSFIRSYDGVSTTFTAYRREVEQLLQWCWHVEGCSFLSLGRDQIERYIQFCQQPPKSWIGVKNVARFISVEGTRTANPDWRPFVAKVNKVARLEGKKPSADDYVLSQAATQVMFAALGSFFRFMIQEQITEVNPIGLIRQKSRYVQRTQHKAPVRRISNLQWDYVMSTATDFASANAGSHERTLFIINCLLAMYLRISELVADERSFPVMGDFSKDRAGNWWFETVGKGNKRRVVSVCDDMLAALKRYRLHLGLPALPYTGETTPLICKLKGAGPVTSTRQIRSLVQDVFDATYEKMKKDGLAADAEELRSATVHWLRHTAISEDMKRRPREHVRDDAGHASMQTTDRYVESDMLERHASAKGKNVRDPH